MSELFQPTSGIIVDAAMNPTSVPGQVMMFGISRQS